MPASGAGSVSGPSGNLLQPDDVIGLADRLDHRAGPDRAFLDRRRGGVAHEPAVDELDALAYLGGTETGAAPVAAPVEADYETETRIRKRRRLRGIDDRFRDLKPIARIALDLAI